MTVKKGELGKKRGYGQRVGFLIYSSGGRVFTGTDTFYVVARGVGGSHGMKVNLTDIG